MLMIFFFLPHMLQIITGHDDIPGLMKKRTKKTTLVHQRGMDKDTRARRKGLKVFEYEDKEGRPKKVYAVNEKNAIKKAKKCGLKV